jgi:putative transcriptional regulator
MGLQHHATFDATLTGQLLVAMPQMSDPRFERSVVYLCAHSDEGAMGLIINKPAPGASMLELLGQLGIEPVPPKLLGNVQFGGPVEVGRGFVLHSADYAADGSTLTVDETFAMTGTLDILRDMAAGGGPRVALLALGYAGWGPGQLESELARNDWLNAAAHPRIVWDLPNAAKWEAALGVLGIDPLTLSAAAGRA